MAQLCFVRCSVGRLGHGPVRPACLDTFEEPSLEQATHPHFSGLQVILVGLRWSCAATICSGLLVIQM
jgi:hypothetical protein